MSPLMRRVSVDKGLKMSEADKTLIEKIDRLFNNMDRDKDGKVTVRELTAVVKAIPDLAKKLGLNDMDHFMKVADLDHSSTIDRDEFHAYLEKHGSPFAASPPTKEQAPSKEQAEAEAAEKEAMRNKVAAEKAKAEKAAAEKRAAEEKEAAEARERQLLRFD